MATEQSTGELFGLAVEGNEAAWTTLVDRLSPAIWSAARTCGLTKAQAEDVFSTVWLRLMDRHETIRDPDRLAGWIHTTARYEALAVARASSRFRDHDLDLRESAEQTTEDVVEHSYTNQALWDGLNAIDDRCRHLLRLLTTVPKVPYKVIAEHLQISVGSIGPTRERCLGKLRATPAVADFMKAAM